MKKTLFTLCSIISIISAPTIVSADSDASVVSASDKVTCLPKCRTDDFGSSSHSHDIKVSLVYDKNCKELTDSVAGLLCESRVNGHYVLTPTPTPTSMADISSNSSDPLVLFRCKDENWDMFENKSGDCCKGENCTKVEFSNDDCTKKTVWHDDTHWYDNKCSGGDDSNKKAQPIKEGVTTPAPDPVIGEPETGQTGCSGTCCADLPKHADVRGAMDVLNNFASNAKVSVWVNKDGGFNYARLAADGAAGAVLGTVGGVITHAVIKKNQVDDGMDGYHCTVASESVADYGDEFMLGIPQ